MTIVASSNGVITTGVNTDGSTWKKVSRPNEIYTIPANYHPHHLKLLKVACKLFLGVKMPGLINDEKKFKVTLQTTASFYKRRLQYKQSI